MTTQEWLYRGWNLNEELDILSETKRQAWERVTSLTAASGGDGVSVSKDPHKMEAYVALCGQIDEKVGELNQIKAELARAINHVEDRRFRMLLTERYVNCKTWERVAQRLHYSRGHLDRLHKAAVAAIEPICQKMWVE